MMLGALNCKTEELLLSVMITMISAAKNSLFIFVFPKSLGISPQDSKIYSFVDFRAEQKYALSILIGCH